MKHVSRRSWYSEQLRLCTDMSRMEPVEGSSRQGLSRLKLRVRIPGDPRDCCKLQSCKAHPLEQLLSRPAGATSPRTRCTPDFSRAAPLQNSPSRASASDASACGVCTHHESDCLAFLAFLGGPGLPAARPPALLVAVSGPSVSAVRSSRRLGKQ